MIEFTRNEFVFRLEQNTIINSNCTLKIYDKEYNLIKIKVVPIGKLSDFLLENFYVKENIKNLGNRMR